MSTRGSKLLAIVVAPPAYMAQVFLSTLQTGGSFLDFLRPVMPFFSSLLGFFGKLLIPLGEFFGTMLDEPLTALSEAIPSRDWTGYAPYIVVFAAIFTMALIFNVVWRPLGYATTESRAKRDAKEAKWAEKEAAKEEAKAKRKVEKKRRAAEATTKTEPVPVKEPEPASPEPAPSKATDAVPVSKDEPQKNDRRDGEKSVENKPDETHQGKTGNGETFVSEGKGPI